MSQQYEKFLFVQSRKFRFDGSWRKHERSCGCQPRSGTGSRSCTKSTNDNAAAGGGGIGSERVLRITRMRAKCGQCGEWFDTPAPWRQSLPCLRVDSFTELGPGGSLPGLSDSVILHDMGVLPQNRALGKFKKNQVRTVGPALAPRAKLLPTGELGANRNQTEIKRIKPDAARWQAKSRDWCAVCREDGRRRNQVLVKLPFPSESGSIITRLRWPKPARIMARPDFSLPSNALAQLESEAQHGYGS